MFNIPIVSVIFSSFNSPSLPMKDSDKYELELECFQSFTWHPLVCAGVKCLPVVQELGAARPLRPEPPGAGGQSSVRARAGVKTELGHGVRKPGLLESIT